MKILQKVEELLNEDSNFLLLEDRTADNWHKNISHYLSKIKNHEYENKHIVREFGKITTNYNTGTKEYKKIWICENCSMVFLKVKFDPELLKIKEFYQMCFDGNLPNLAEFGMAEQIKRISK